MITKPIDWKRSWSIPVTSVCVILALALLTNAKPQEEKEKEKLPSAYYLDDDLYYEPNSQEKEKKQIARVPSYEMQLNTPLPLSRDEQKNSQTSEKEETIDPKRVPKIVSTFPKNNAKNVDPNITQVYVTFDIPMDGGVAMAHRSKQTTLDLDKDQGVFWTADMKTCVAPVKLKPNKTYEILMNVPPFIGFASEAGVASKQLFFTFKTGGGSVTNDARAKYAAKNLTEESSSPDPTAAETPMASSGKFVDAELEKKARVALKTMAERNKVWLFAENDQLKSWSYHFKVVPGDEKMETNEHEITIDEKGENWEEMRGTTYESVLQHLAELARDDKTADKIRFKAVDMDDNEIKLHFVVTGEPLRCQCGNGMIGSWYGYFIMTTKEGKLTLDRKTLVPKMLLASKKVAERFGGYTKLGDDLYAPKRIQVKNGDVLFDMKFSIYEPGLWLLDTSKYVYERGDEKIESTVEISDVKVNGEAAMEMVK